ncbi:uncharacterized protein TRAVEDRAFT_71126 [Trametes versicolor FP-101664 SS1]|uniref:uncharacterized protein n=1 Tax=Trametes versicolor (strain FP-101664) TaxID=717944 RepID=UPI0004621B39|nr:uncharacterized protein TRAVEDRAFT_71126 [Trametes versicolor FP-101664 SS1]EIW60881.1 hypothetical protein TRAVEDRAFT_71126 [Trametes versicolor FP-101664 SS1]
MLGNYLEVYCTATLANRVGGFICLICRRLHGRSWLGVSPRPLRLPLVVGRYEVYGNMNAVGGGRLADSVSPRPESRASRKSHIRKIAYPKKSHIQKIAQLSELTQSVAFRDDCSEVRGKWALRSGLGGYKLGSSTTKELLQSTIS